MKNISGIETHSPGAATHLADSSARRAGTTLAQGNALGDWVTPPMQPVRLRGLSQPYRLPDFFPLGYPGRCPGLMQFQPSGLNRCDRPERSHGDRNEHPLHSQKSLRLFSPAKINLFLRVLGKRTDGYHELASLFQAIDLGDTLTLTLSQEDKLTCSNPTLPCDSSNLIAKALDLFRRKTGLRFRVAIHLEKKIPTHAGLGGGSSNAATTLWALNALHNFPYTEQELQIWSAAIGSDIPFFFSHGTAYCTGRGEKVRDLPVPPLPPFSIIKPSEGLPTPAIFKILQLHECSSEDPEKILADFYVGKPRYINDLEIPAFRLCPSLSEIKQTHSLAFMTGSGTAMVHQGEQGQSIRLVNRTTSWY